MRLIKVIPVIRITVVIILFCLTSCASTVIGTATDAAIAVAKVPFKVGGAVVDVVTHDDKDKKQDKDEDKNKD